MTPAPKRSWFRFGLRTMFAIMTLVSVGIAIPGLWTLRWIADRKAFLSELELDWDDAPDQFRRWRVRPDVAASAGYGERFTLWFFKEPPQSQIKIPVVVGDRMSYSLKSNPKVLEAARLFPEADICGIPLPWHPVLGPRLSGRLPDRKVSIFDPKPSVYGVPRFPLP